MPNELPRWRTDRIVNGLTNGAVIAYPTEGVWGLGCLPDLDVSVGHMLNLKRRDWREGLILIASDISHVNQYLEGISPEAREQLKQVWPSAVTFLVPDNGSVPTWIKGAHSRIALRVSTHPTVRSICDALGGAIVSTSANPTGRPPALDALRVRQYFGSEVDFIVPGQLGDQDGPSEIRDLESGAVIRPGKSG
ncbi:MAG TPA: tRNA threonylcarbamoyladenosine biosynthesis protein RimN [Gammaproteobacteria bacterium]|nr:tRNA threonylcarbamoyladenosine biosynthesis protein RimN [Gammaproteobacteria bacterium]